MLPASVLIGIYGDRKGVRVHTSIMLDRWRSVSRIGGGLAGFLTSP